MTSTKNKIATRWIGTRYADGDGEYIITHLDRAGTEEIQNNCDVPVVRLHLKNLIGGDDRLLDVHYDGVCLCDW